MGQREAAGRTLPFVLGVYAASRLLYFAAGAIMARTLPISSFQRRTSDVPYGRLNTWSHWDGEHYIHLAASGYLNLHYDESPAFFPLYPLLVRALDSLFGGPVSLPALGVWGVIVSLAALPFALYFVYRLAEDAGGPRTARASVLVLAFFPTAFFLNAVYTESLFLALSAGALWAVRVRKNLLLACVLAGLACATRNVGIFLLVPLALEWLRRRREYGLRGAACLALAPSGLLLYAAYLWWRFGNPLLFYTGQRRWGREPTGPLHALVTAFEQAGRGLAQLSGMRPGSGSGSLMDHLAATNETYNLLFLLLALTLLVAGARSLPPGMSAYAFLLVAVPALFGTPQDPLMGMPRFVLVAFPIFITLGALVGKRKVALRLWLAVNIAFSLFLCALFVSWRFVA